MGRGRSRRIGEVVGAGIGAERGRGTAHFSTWERKEGWEISRENANRCASRCECYQGLQFGSVLES